MEDFNPLNEKHIQISNAGLCLLTPWLNRLFDMLDYLNEEKTFVNTEAQIHAVFLLQYFVYGDDREYLETELSFNRLLVGLPWHVPLPKHMPFSRRETDVVDSLLTAVKNQWPQMKDKSSVKGFMESFIARSGTLEQQEEQWLLVVDAKTYDMLLDTVPWSFRRIQLPWMEKRISVVWHNG